MSPHIAGRKSAAELKGVCLYCFTQVLLMQGFVEITSAIRPGDTWYRAQGIVNLVRILMVDVNCCTRTDYVRTTCSNARQSAGAVLRKPCGSDSRVLSYIYVYLSSLLLRRFSHFVTSSFNTVSSITSWHAPVVPASVDSAAWHSMKGFQYEYLNRCINKDIIYGTDS